MTLTLTSFMTLTSDKSNQVKTDVQVAKLAFSKRWPWPWPNDLDTQTWPRYCQDVSSHQKSFYVNCFKSYSPNRHTHTDTDMMKTLPLLHMREVIIRHRYVDVFILWLRYLPVHSDYCMFCKVGLNWLQQSMFYLY